jgi:hypothetical protein
MKVKIEIDCDNAAFDGNWTGEVQRILRGITSGRLLSVEDFGPANLRDSNGNTVGQMEVTND